ncbi:MAG TPA: hypothetical protein VFX63_03820 [Pyrinomonadaceae bacterium]|nr:hypothetical protein [Pyrinomonadaceae bacterium]
MVLRICLIVLFAFGSAAAQVNVKLVTDEAEAVLSALAKRKANQTITETDWQRIFQSEGYVRLKKRETSMQRSFEDPDFKTFVMSAELAQRLPSLEETLARWKSADVSGAATGARLFTERRADPRKDLSSDQATREQFRV